MSNPFLIEGPAQISFSGGRSSAFMLFKILEAHGGFLPDDVIVTFANTGREFEQTLVFVREVSRRWAVRIRWLEYDPDAANGFREVTFETASRAGEPFERMIRRKRYMPNPATRICTINLKLKVQEAFLASMGWRNTQQCWACVPMNLDGWRRYEGASPRAKSLKHLLGQPRSRSAMCGHSGTYSPSTFS